MFDVDADSGYGSVEVFVVVGAGLVGRFPVGGMGAVSEDEVSLLDRFGESTREEEQDCFEEDSDTSPGFWRSWADRLPGGRRPPSGAGSGEGSAGRPPPGPAGRYGMWIDSSLDLRSHRRYGR